MIFRRSRAKVGSSSCFSGMRCLGWEQSQPSVSGSLLRFGGAKNHRTVDGWALEFWWNLPGGGELAGDLFLQLTSPQLNHSELHRLGVDSEC